jgi:hypothetical protein
MAWNSLGAGVVPGRRRGHQIASFNILTWRQRASHALHRVPKRKMERSQVISDKSGHNLSSLFANMRRERMRERESGLRVHLFRLGHTRT